MTTSGPPRVRFAPSPTGHLHVGGARTALFNWLFARGTGGTFVLRIEDTDRDRSSDEMSEAILDGMRWLGLDWDEGPFHQADGWMRHAADAQRLLDSGHAYRCFCLPEELQARREAAEEAAGPGAYRYDRRCTRLSGPERTRRAEAAELHTLRFLVTDGVTEWDDIVHGPTRFRNSDIDDFILLRSDGTPVYNLAVVSDDIEMGISHVIRGDDHLSNTPKQLLLYRALGAAEPRFAHVPMILGPDGKRLSKRHGATSIGEYREGGLLPEALTNFLALLGWNPGDDQEIMTRADLVDRFSLERINKKSAVFDPEKLEWMNGQHLQLTTGRELVPLVAPYLIERGLTSPEDLADRADWFAGLMELLKTRGRTLPAIAELVYPFLAPEVEYNAAAVRKHWKEQGSALARLDLVAGALEDAEWTPAGVDSALRAAAEGAGLGFGKIVHPLRVALTGGEASPPIDELLALMGPDLVRRRIEAARAFLRAATAGEANVDTPPGQT